METRTIIVGGGIAGMACAARLLEAGHPFLLVTDRLGGRILYSEEAKVNYGAYFVMGNYRHARTLLRRGALISPLSVCFHNSEVERFGVLSLHTLGRMREFIRFVGVMREFSAHYEAFKERCLRMTQREALEADPYMAEVSLTPAAEFVRVKGYEKFAADYVSKFAYACTGAVMEDIWALDFLNVSMGLIVPIHHFQFDRGAMEARLGERLQEDTIEGLERLERGYLLRGRGGQTYRAESVVLATPAAVTKELLHLEEIRGACRIYVHHVRGRLKKAYQRFGINLFAQTSEIMLTAKQFDGTYLVYSRVKGADLGKVCDEFDLLAEADWEKAMYVEGKARVEQEYGEGLFVAGDHNGLGLEPTAISGIFAARRALERAGKLDAEGGRRS